VFPVVLLHADAGRRRASASRCAARRATGCRSTLVSHEHVDLPFHNDRRVGVVEHVFHDDAYATLEEFRTELWSASFDARRLGPVERREPRSGLRPFFP